MIELIKDLDKATSILFFALNKYLDACSAIQNYCEQTSDRDISSTLSNRIVDELVLLTTHERNVKKARSIIAQTRNSSAIVPINSLPPEILIRIFHLVVGSRPCEVTDRSGEFIRFPKYPDFLAYVCSRWRRLAINTPNLWTHIDLVPYHSLSKGFEARAHLSAIRARSSLLDIHIYEPAFLRGFDQRDMLEFIAYMGDQIGSFELVIPQTSSELDSEALELLECCFQNCEPGTLTKLTITDAGEMAPTFVEAAYEPDDVDGRWLRLAPEDLEETLMDLTVLRLDGVYFHWTNPVYRNLVELRLTSSRKPAASLPETQLVDILTACPRLHVLHFGLEITDTLPENTSTQPVPLEELEVLNLTSMDYDEVGTLLRLLGPGSKPLQLSVQLDDARASNSPIYGDELIKFIERSNVTKFFMGIASWTAYPSDLSNIDEILAPLHKLRTLALSNFHWSSAAVPNTENQYTLPKDLCLDVLYLLDCFAEVEELRQVIRRLSVEILVLWDCRIKDGRTQLSDQDVKTALSGACSAVRVKTGGSSPIEDWDWD